MWNNEIETHDFILKRNIIFISLGPILTKTVHKIWNMPAKYKTWNLENKEIFHQQSINLLHPTFVRYKTYSEYSPYYFLSISVILALISNLRLDGVFWPWIALVLARLMSFRLVCLCLINMIFKQIMALSDKAWTMAGNSVENLINLTIKCCPKAGTEFACRLVIGNTKLNPCVRCTVPWTTTVDKITSD